MTEPSDHVDRDWAHCRPFDEEVYDCRFEHCDFTEADFTEVMFNGCSFAGCNLSMAAVGGARFQGVTFDDCKLLGVDFSTCSGFAFSVDFHGCNLNYASFLEKPMRQTEFRDCSLNDVDFKGADLREAIFAECDLTGAVFEQTGLEKADLRTACHYVIDPDLNRVEGAHFSGHKLAGLLVKYNLEIE